MNKLEFVDHIMNQFFFKQEQTVFSYQKPLEIIGSLKIFEINKSVCFTLVIGRYFYDYDLDAKGKTVLKNKNA
jgi:hypothetical protein